MHSDQKAPLTLKIAAIGGLLFLHLPIWMLEELVRPRQRPVTNVIAMVVVLATFLPILGAYYLTRSGADTAGSGK